MIYRGKDFAVQGTPEEIAAFFHLMEHMREHPEEHDLVMALLNTIFTKGERQ